MSDSRRLLVITYHFGREGPVGGLRWLGMTKYLARLGWQVTIVTAAAPTPGDAANGVRVEWCPRLATFLDGMRLLRGRTLGQSPGRFANGSRSAYQSEPRGLLRQVTREVTACFAFPDDSRGWMFRAAQRTRSIIWAFRPQVVVSSGPPHSAHVVARMATLGTPARWLIDLRDPWAGPLPEVWRSHRIGTRVFRALTPRLERLAFNAADGVVTTTRELAEALAAGYPRVPIMCIPNGVDAECLPPPPRHLYPGLSIAHAGTLYAGRDLGPVVRALRIFLDRHPEAAHAGSKLRIAGDADPGHARAFSHAVAETGMEPYIEVLGPLPRAQAQNVVAQSRLVVVLAQQQALQIPAKLYESVAMGVPTLVVAPLDSATAIEGNRVGAIVRDSADVEGIARVLEQLWRDGSRRRSPSSVPITYEAIAPAVDRILRQAAFERVMAPS